MTGENKKGGVGRLNLLIFTKQMFTEYLLCAGHLVGAEDTALS